MTKTDPVSGALAIYVHWPFCESKCPYCDFNSHARRSIKEDEFLSALIAELRFYAEETKRRAVTSIFFGGGTPSLMHEGTVGAILDTIAAHWDMSESCEITLEANPSSVEAARFSGYRNAGVNRVSLGVQSLRDHGLRFLGRLHSALEARQAVEIAARHFDRVSFDLIYARPGQNGAAWKAELQEALAMERGHLSLYQLTIEPGTAFHDLHDRGKLHVPASDAAAHLYELTQEVCAAAGLPAYEISNHARAGEESRHNLNYWRYGDYIGVGPGAHGRLTLAARSHATAAIRAPSDWHRQVLALGHGCEERSALGTREEAEEMLLMGLRLAEGLDLARLEAETGFRPRPSEIVAFEGDGLLFRGASRIWLSESGKLVLNAIVAALASSLQERGQAQY